MNIETILLEEDLTIEDKEGYPKIINRDSVIFVEGKYIIDVRKFLDKRLVWDRMDTKNLKELIYDV